jgi:alkylhydroperoxidase family enzyme
MGRQAGLSDEEIARVREGADAAGWSPFEAAILRATDELHDGAALGDSTWQALRERYDDRQMLDLIFTIGQYHLIAMVLNGIRVDLDAGVEGLEYP